MYEEIIVISRLNEFKETFGYGFGLFVLGVSSVDLVIVLIF